MTNYHAALFRPKPQPPQRNSGSWWLEADHFYARAKIEQPRMSQSKFATISTLARYDGDTLIAARAVGKSR